MNTQPLIGPIRLFGTAWNFYKTHWKTLTTIVVLPFGGVFIGNLISQIALNIADTSTVAATILSIIGLILFLAALVFVIAAVSGLMSSIHKLSTEPGHKIHFWNQYKLGFHYFWPLVLVGIMRAAGMFGASTIFIIPGIIFAVYSAFILFTLVIDDKRGMAAFTESFALVHKRWWKVCGRLLFIVLVYVVALFVVTGLSFLGQLIFGYALNSLADGIVKGLLMAILVLVYMPLVTTYLYKLFQALKAGRLEEGRHTKIFRDLFIACMVIGAVIFIGTIVFGGIFNRDNHPRRTPYTSGMALTITPHTHGNLVL
jgi:hypothetical protein